MSGIFEVKQYVKTIEDGDDNSVMIVHHWVGEKEKFYGSATVGYSFGGREQRMPIRFEIGATTIEEAFEKFDAAAKEASDDMAQQLNREIAEQRSRLVVPKGKVSAEKILKFDDFTKKKE